MRFEDTEQYQIAKAVYDKLMENDTIQKYYPNRHSDFGLNISIQWTEHPFLYVTSDLLDSRIRGVGGGNIESSYYFTILITQVLSPKNYADDFSVLEELTYLIYSIHKDNFVTNYGITSPKHGNDIQFMPGLVVEQSEQWNNFDGKEDMLIVYRWISGSVMIR